MHGRQHSEHSGGSTVSTVVAAYASTSESETGARSVEAAASTSMAGNALSAEVRKHMSAQASAQ